MTIVTLSSRGRLLEPLAPAWQRWGGAFSGSRMLEEHLAEHEEEVRRGT